MRIFLAGAAGAIGRRLVPLLVAAGHEVTGTTRSAEAARKLEAAGIRAAIVDVCDAAALARAATQAKPDVVVHQITDLPRSFDQKEIAASYQRNARIRVEGTRNLIAAAQAAGAGRFIVQSVAFAYAPGCEPHGEEDPLNLADRPRVETVRGAADMERQVLTSATASFTAPAPGTMVRAPNLRSTSMQPQTRRCWRSAAALRASTTSPTTMARCRSKKPVASSASTRLSDCRFNGPQSYLFKRLR